VNPDLERKLASIVAAKKAADDAAKSADRETARKESAQRAHVAAAHDTWLHQTVPMMAKTVAEMNDKLQPADLWMSLDVDASPQRSALGASTLTLHVDGKPTQNTQTIWLDEEGDLHLGFHIGGMDRQMPSLDNDRPLNEDRFGRLVYEFLSLCMAKPGTLEQVLAALRDNEDEAD
jgi:hypothetical protein